MKKKCLVMMLLAAGVSLVLLSLILSNYELQNVSIIGGVSWPTYWYMFTAGKNGLYFYLAGLGIMAIIAAIITGCKSNFIKNISTLIAPLWSLKKFVVLNEIDKEMVRRNTYQGSRCGK